MQDVNWTHAEKKAEKALFDSALQRELNRYIGSFKQSAAAIEDARGALVAAAAGGAEAARD